LNQQVTEQSEVILYNKEGNNLITEFVKKRRSMGQNNKIIEGWILFSGGKAL